MSNSGGHEPAWFPDGGMIALTGGDNTWVTGASGSVPIDRRRIGISINNGRCCTNNPDVVVRGKGPDGFTSMIVSNDGGFAHYDNFLLTGTTVPWTLQDTGPERLPKTVYAQFEDPYTGESSTTYSDDIILDQTSPLISRLSARPLGLRATDSLPNGLRARKGKTRGGYMLKIKARDNASGVKRMKVATSRRQRTRVKWRKFRRQSYVSMKSPRLYVRVQDGAGNSSKWRRSKLRR